MINNTDVVNTTGNTGESALDTIAKNRRLIPLAFSLVIIFFFLGFCDFTCNSMKMASLSGINLVTGTTVQMNAGGIFDDNSFPSMGRRSEKQADKGQKVEPNIWAILAFLSAIGGLAAFYKKIRKESLAGVAMGALGCISLLILRSAIKSKVEEQGGSMVRIEIHFLFGYWASILAFLVAGGISYLRLKQVKTVQPPLTAVEPGPQAVTSLHVNIITQDKNSGQQ